METPFAIMINLPESFGLKEAKRLARELRKQLTSQTASVVVDLSRVKKMDSEGLAGLLSCMQEVAKRDGSVQLGAISPEAATLLELARMDHLFDKFPSVAAGVPGVAISAAPVTEVAQPEGPIQPAPVVA